jgi:hypothetical protein
VAELPEDDKQLLKLVVGRISSFEDTTRRHHSHLWDRMDSLYHAYRGLKTSHANTGPNDRYPILRNAQESFGHDLFIPYAFSVVETTLPRLLSNRPRMLVLPRNKQSERNVENMRGLIDAQQSQISYELKVQESAKAGLIYGLGPQRTYWKRIEGQKTKVMPSSWVLQKLGKPYKKVVVPDRPFDDPVAEAVNIRDFFWDPYAANVETARWMASRSWRDTAHCKAMRDSGTWNHHQPSDEDLEHGSGKLYTDAHRGARRAQGMPDPKERDTDIHEVLEYEDGCHIVTVLDRQWIVMIQENEAFYGRHIYQCYRPTQVLGSLHGKGVIEPIEDLQLEINMLRTNRMWNAIMVLHQAYAYNDGLIDPHRIKIGPGALIPVNGDPKEILHPLTQGDIPNSSYREAAEIQADIERTSGISDSTSGADTGAAQTATGIQLVQASANARIQLMTRRAEVELIREGARHWIALNQLHVLENREVQVPAPPTPEEPERRYLWLQCGPRELAGEFDIEPEGGSTTPENVPQMRQDAQIKLSVLQSGAPVDARRFMVSILEDLGLKNPESYLPPEIVIPPQTLEYIVQGIAQAGGDPQMAQQIVIGALNTALDEQQQVNAGQQPVPGGGEPPEPQPGE